MDILMENTNKGSPLKCSMLVAIPRVLNLFRLASSSSSSGGNGGIPGGILGGCGEPPPPPPPPLPPQL